MSHVCVAPGTPIRPERLLVAAVTCDDRLVPAGLVTVVALVALIIVGWAAVRTVPPQQTYVVELLGRCRRTLEPGIHLLVPFIESVHAKVNMREQAASFPPQPAIASDNLVACIETVLYYRVVDPLRATYETVNSVRAMEMLTITTLRNLTGSMDLERVRASRDELNLRLTEVLDRQEHRRLGHQGDLGGDQGNRNRLKARLSLTTGRFGPLPAARYADTWRRPGPVPDYSCQTDRSR
jgi:hypothetical protein